MPPPTVFVIDDNASVRDALRWLFSSVGLEAQTFASAQTFLDAGPTDGAGCVVADVRMPDMSGLDLQRKLKAAGGFLPFIVITGHADVKMAVHAMKAGAFDFFEKPFDDQELLDAVQQAIAHHAGLLDKRDRMLEMRARLAALTTREQEVLGLIAAGNTNKVIARLLGIGVKTVEFHRANLMRKTKVRSLAELVRMGLDLARD